MISTPSACLRASRLVPRVSSTFLPKSTSTKASTFCLLQSSSCRAFTNSTKCTNSLRNFTVSYKRFHIIKPLSSTRFASTTADASHTPSPITASTSEAISTLTWDRFLHLRAIRRRYNVAASVVTSLGTGFAGVAILSNQDIESLFGGGIPFGLDPVIALGLATLAFAALGWVMGPFAGNAVFGVVYRRAKPEMAMKEKDLYHRLLKYRSSPEGQSMSNPMPDYYGEKISSVSAYRQWLKDQRAFRKKREGYSG